MTRFPFVSIVVPARNEERRIAACLSSLLVLDYPKDRREIIVVNNGSSDRTAEIIDRHPVVRIDQVTPGISLTRNAGVRAARGSACSG